MFPFGYLIVGTPTTELDDGLGVEVAVGSTGVSVELAVGVGKGVSGAGAVNVAGTVIDGTAACWTGVAEGWANVWVGWTGSSVRAVGEDVNVEAETMPAEKSPFFVKYQPPIPNKRRSGRMNIHLFIFRGCLAARAVTTGESTKG